jgi:type IV pilus assembly protein PilQ
MKLNNPVTLLASTLVALTMFSLPASAQRNSSSDPGNPQAVIKDMDLRDRPLKQVVEFLREKSGINIVIDEDIDARVTLKLRDVHWRDALDLAVERAGCVIVQKARNVLKIENPPRVVFAFDKAEIGTVIDAIGRISGANIIVAPEVQGSITLRLKDVPWRDALDQVVKTLGFTVVEEDRSILRVVSPSTLVDQLVTKSFQLRFVRPRSTFVPKITSQYVTGAVYAPTGNPRDSFSLLTALGRMLSDNGKLDYIDEKNVILVKDTKPVIDEMSKLIAEIDIEPRQVFVDVQFVTTTNTDVLEYGVNIGDAGWTVAAGLGQIPWKVPFELGSGGWDDNVIANDSEIGPFTDATLNASSNTTVPDTIFGALNFTGVTAALRLLQQDESSEIVQAPKIIALDHQEATIFVGDTVRYAQASSQVGQTGDLQLVVEEAPNSPVQTGFQLLLVPHIVPGEDKVMLELIPESESLTGTGASDLAPTGFDVFRVGSVSGDGSIALPRVSSSTIATKMLLVSGQTAVIGGLTTESNARTVTQVPLLGDIPILGWAFKNKSTTKERRSLIVFVTPEIIRTPEENEDNLRRLLSERKKDLRDEYDRIFGEEGK